MPVIHGWVTFEYTLNATASSTIDLGPGKKCLILKNTDSAIMIWYTLSNKPEVAAVAATPTSFGLAQGESVHYEGIDFQYVTAIAASGTPVLKGQVWCRTGD